MAIEYVHYPATNEGILGIMKGLTPEKGDNILSICGSGDQAFSLLEKGASVLAVDISLPQLAYARKRAEYLKQRKFNEFLYPPGYECIFEDKERSIDIIAREAYFTPERLERIAQNLGNLDFMAKCIYDHVIESNHDFTKIYLSNALEHIVRPVPTDMKAEYQADALNQFAESLKQNGSIFVSGREGGVDSYFRMNPEASPSLRIDGEKTLAARRTVPYHRGIPFIPTVFKKVA